MACCGTREPCPTFMYVFNVLSSEILIIIMLTMKITVTVIAEVETNLIFVCRSLINK